MPVGLPDMPFTHANYEHRDLRVQLLSQPIACVFPFEGTVPRRKGTIPHTKGTVPHTKGTVPRTKSTIPYAKGTVPRTKGTVPRGLIINTRCC